MIRPPAVAGTFYPDDVTALTGMLREMTSSSVEATEAATAVMVPHAGYIYSGAVAGAVYTAVERHRASPNRNRGYPR